MGWTELIQVKAVCLDGDTFMAENEDPKELERKIAQASRLAFRVGDQTTIGKLLIWIDDLKQKLQRASEDRRTQESIRERARELWEEDGRPSGRDLEFWLRAELEYRRTPL